MPTIFSPGDKVHYIAHAGADPQNGIVKSLHPNLSSIVFVVYKCNNDWSNYRNYTAAATSVEEIKKGWYDGKT